MTVTSPPANATTTAAPAALHEDDDGDEAIAEAILAAELASRALANLAGLADLAEAEDDGPSATTDTAACADGDGERRT